LSNPQQLSTNLQTVAGVVSSPTFSSFGALRTATGSPVAAPTVSGALLAAAPITPPATSTQAYAGAPARLEALRLAAATLGSGIAASVIPPAQIGKVYVWDVTTHAYVAQSGGPTNGVRVILYAVNSSDQVIEPTTAVGYVDLLDESTSSTNSLHVLVYGEPRHQVCRLQGERHGHRQPRDGLQRERDGVRDRRDPHAHVHRELRSVAAQHYDPACPGRRHVEPRQSGNERDAVRDRSGVGRQQFDVDDPL
jgi:hypothetical protein